MRILPEWKRQISSCPRPFCGRCGGAGVREVVMGRCLVFAAVSAAFVACGGPYAAPNLRPVRIAIHRDPIAFLPVSVAQTLGYYSQEGLAANVSDVSGGTKAMEALIGGSVDVAAGSMSDVVQVAAEGRKLRGFLVLYPRPS